MNFTLEPFLLGKISICAFFNRFLMISNQRIDCKLFNEDKCRSCSLIASTYDEQIMLKQRNMISKLNQFIRSETLVLSPVTSETEKFRSKAKMVVTGTVEKVNLGILNEDKTGVDLTDCLLYTDSITFTFSILKMFIIKAGLSPYNVKSKKGVLKYILIYESISTKELMIRFVLKDKSKLASIQDQLHILTDKLPMLKVISVNIQPIHQAVLEGDEEIILTEHHRILEVLNEIPLYIQPKSFFQTNPVLAAKLYQKAADWALQCKASKVWDLFCGVGGFGLHALKALTDNNIDATLVGIEIEPNAIESALVSANRLGLQHVEFSALDSTLFAEQKLNDIKPDLLIVNPPRRGLGDVLTKQINAQSIPHLIYSSCHIDSLENDLKLLDQYHITQLQLYDFFPHTPHFEILVKLEKSH